MFLSFLSFFSHKSFMVNMILCIYNYCVTMYCSTITGCHRKTAACHVTNPSMCCNYCFIVLHQCLSQDLDFSQKRSYLICLWSYLQKRGVIHSQRKSRDKARKLRERVRSLYILHAQNTKIVAS